jgi:hypothetical protein
MMDRGGCSGCWQFEPALPFGQFAGRSGRVCRYVEGQYWGI